jgi:hypothetical protein
MHIELFSNNLLKNTYNLNLFLYNYKSLLKINKQSLQNHFFKRGNL